jgi:hypothetical protein
MKIHITLICFSFLTACVDGGLGMVGSPAWQMSTTQEEKIAYFSDICESYGFKKGTQAFAQCIQQESQSARAAGTARAQAILAAPAFRPPTSSTCREFGNSITCQTN